MTKLGFYFPNQDEAELCLLTKAHGYVMHPSSKDDRFITVTFKKHTGSMLTSRISLEPDGRFKLNDTEFFYDLGDMVQRFANILAT